MVRYGPDLVSHSHQKQAPFSAIDGNLPDELVETLGIELFSDGADASFSGLPLLESLIQFLLKIKDILLGSRRSRH